jgi:ribosomal protein S27E
MSMPGDDKKNKKGFSGLSSLASDISSNNDDSHESSSSTDKRPSALPDNSDQKPEEIKGNRVIVRCPECREKLELLFETAGTSHARCDFCNARFQYSGRKGVFPKNDKKGVLGFWVIVLISCLGLSILYASIYEGSIFEQNYKRYKKDHKKLSKSEAGNQNAKSISPTPTVKNKLSRRSTVDSKPIQRNFPTKNQSSSLEFEKPPVGTNNILSVSQIRWCLREKIWIDKRKQLINAEAANIERMRKRFEANYSTDQSIDSFNANIGKFNSTNDAVGGIIDNFNQRCASYRYRPGVLERAKGDVNSIRNQIDAVPINGAG